MSLVPRPDLVPTSSRTTSSLVPSPTRVRGRGRTPRRTDLVPDLGLAPWRPGENFDHRLHDPRRRQPCLLTPFFSTGTRGMKRDADARRCHMIFAQKIHGWAIMTPEPVRRLPLRHLKPSGVGAP